MSSMRIFQWRDYCDAPESFPIMASPCASRHCEECKMARLKANFPCHCGAKAEVNPTFSVIARNEVTKQSRSAGACLPLAEGSEVVLKIRRMD